MLIKLRKSRVLGKQGFLSSHASVKHPQGRVQHGRSLLAALSAAASLSRPTRLGKGFQLTALVFLVKRSLCDFFLFFLIYIYIYDFFFFLLISNLAGFKLWPITPPTLLANKINFYGP